MFSVVIPLYNKAQTIRGTLNSLMQQEFSDFEIIVVNDGSTDNSLEVVREMHANREIRVVSQENRGVSAARNYGIALARFEYIALLDADDEWEPGFLLQIKTAIEKFPDAGFYGAASWHRNITSGEQSCHILPKYRDKILKVEYLSDPHHMPHTSAMVLSRKYFLQIDSNGEGFPVGMKVCEDWACFYRLAFIADFVFVGFPLGIRNTNVEGQITGLTPEQRFALMKHVVEFYNITFESWKKSIFKKKLYPGFLKYDLRARAFASLRIGDYSTINFLYAGLSEDILGRFSNVEIAIINSRKYKVISLLYIAFTKIVWKVGRLFNLHNG
jgi:glycosyltransferase involved in cell wall biosynthesis